MADEKNVIDLGLPAGKLIAQYPDLPGLLAEMGIEDVDAEKTLPEVAADLGVETSVIAFALEASGYDVQGLKAADDGYKSPLTDVMSVLFDNSFHGEPLPDTSSSGPMLAHMEMAIRRAQDEGKLPK
ncbi:hypothetical protein DWW58_07785 [Olsenella sp. AF16-14LB]|uniref:hypothetical protein n=1 Tax=Atopobiaceae TaxID=1643824 RepID=UPI0005099896|nr:MULTISPECIES: hypothetical protein [unclassified Olsenella]RGJ46105.1 hypothetical protein DXD59_06230 [Olsenella sp. TM06-36]RGU50073.1 hypothetical protein DWW58_07785 [Olsenella sp. AF16-14LB]RGU81118.1 hypothetical protein DWW44_09335 [Olsenella sp. AF15-43LB]RHB53168.1 hypothetical protein DW878_10085 [Olsenella sp. AM39-30AC]RHJ90610.1 hypothetical protein DW092_10635 [Olsenella sp. AM05-7]